MKPILYRVRQFIQSIWTISSPRDLQVVQSHLPTALQQLFERMSPADQAHSIRVCQSLLKQGHDDPDLLVAALLHDVGKSIVRPTVWERVLFVLANRIAPRQVLKWGEAEVKGWKRAFVIAHKHPEWGAELVAEHGGSPAAVDLIRNHQAVGGWTQDAELSSYLTLLQSADGEN